MNQKLCLLEEAVGVTAVCPEDACPFWDAGGSVLSSGCAIERLGIGGELRRAPELADWLLSVREQLDHSAATEHRAAYNAVRQLLPPGLHD
jgi:hypothetical protein